LLVTAEDEQAQVDYLVQWILEHREAGIDLNRQAVLMRAGHHSDMLEVELGRRNIPFVKYGGLKFLEAAHVKDVLCVLRWAENPRDEVAAFRVLQLLPGLGPAHARRIHERFEAMGFDFKGLEGVAVPTAARADWPAFCEMMCGLGRGTTDWQGQLGMVRRWYEAHLERLHDAAHMRAADLEQLEQLAAGYPTRERFLSELTLDPPDAVGDEAADPYLDEDHLILSTIHSAKGQEWDVVYVLNVLDGCIPSDMATRTPEEIEEERRLLYVAMTRARDYLHLVYPHRFYTRKRPDGDNHLYAPRTRFIPDALLALFERDAHGTNQATDSPGNPIVSRIDVQTRIREMWG
jgi:DNA helicase-2/ATP-dependent DNA helicase PcrA